MSRFAVYEVKVSDARWLSRSKPKTTAPAQRVSSEQLMYMHSCAYISACKKGPTGTSETHSRLSLAAHLYFLVALKRDQGKPVKWDPRHSIYIAVGIRGQIINVLRERPSNSAAQHLRGAACSGLPRLCKHVVTLRVLRVVPRLQPAFIACRNKRRYPGNIEKSYTGNIRES